MPNTPRGNQRNNFGEGSPKKETDLGRAMRTGERLGEGKNARARAKEHQVRKKEEPKPFNQPEIGPEYFPDPMKKPFIAPPLRDLNKPKPTEKELKDANKEWMDKRKKEERRRNGLNRRWMEDQRRRLEQENKERKLQGKEPKKAPKWWDNPQNPNKDKKPFPSNLVAKNTKRKSRASRKSKSRPIA